MTAPLVSVVMAVRNGERYLRKAVSSILTQSLRDLELVVVDDGSSDATPDILRTMQALDQRVVVESSHGHGLAAALNIGTSLAQGRWIARMDADDISHPERLARQLSFATLQGLDVCGCDARTFGATIPRVLRHARSHAAIRLELMFGAPFAHPTVLGKREFIANAYGNGVDGAEDFVLWAKLAAAGARMGNLPSALLRYRVHPQQVTSRGPSERVGVAINVAKEYWPTLIPDLHTRDDLRVTDSLLSVVFDKSLAVEDDVARMLLRILLELNAKYGNPEGILSRVAFTVLIRSSPALQRESISRVLSSHLGLGGRLVLFARRLLPIDWDSAGIRLVRKYLR